MSADRELLELAAKAVGITLSKQDEYRPNELADVTDPSRPRYWNPLADDGDALRLAVKLRLEIVPLEGDGVDICRTTEEEPFGVLLATEGGIDQLAATRRAIVRAAAKIGRAMP